MRLDRQKFSSWLREKRPEEIVGENRDCHTCPIARFYLEATGSEIVISGRGGDYFIDRGDGERLLPKWASCFISEVDSNAAKFVSARRALEILNAV